MSSSRNNRDVSFEPAPELVKKTINNSESQTRACCSSWLSAAFGVLIFALGVVILAWLPSFVRDKIRQELSLEHPRTILYQGFRNQSHDVQVRFVYQFFNVTNYHDVEHHGARPELQLCGPYVYVRIKWRPEDHVYWDADGVLHYKTLMYFEFNKELSGPGLSESDMIYTPRAGIFVALQESRGHKALLDFESLLMWMDNVTTVFQHRNVSQLTHGYNEPFLDNFKIFGVDPIVAFAPAVTDINTAGESAIYGGGPTSSSINTNESKRKVLDRDIGQYYKWHGYDSLPYWDDAYANALNGSDGSMFKPDLFDTKQMYIFVDNLKRSLLAQHSTNVDFHGIDLQRYTLDRRSLASQWVNPDNKAFHINESGLQPIPPVKGCDAEWTFAVLGMPFYLDCDTRNVRLDLPRKASVELDDSHLDIEPYSGILLHVRNQLMASVRLRPVNVTVKGKNYTLGPTKNLPDTWLPAFIASEEYHMPEHWREKIKLEILLPMTLSKAVGIPFIVIGVAMVGWVCYKKCCAAASDEDEKQKQA